MYRQRLMRLAALLTVLAVSAAIFVGTASAAGPAALNDTLSLDGGDSTIVNVLNNDTDPDGDDLEVIWATAGTVGGAQVECEATGECRYYAAQGTTYPYEDQFDYEISDNLGNSDVGTVIVTVRDPAGPQPQTFGRELTLALTGHVTASGSVSADDAAPQACENGITVEVQRKVRGAFTKVAEGTTNNNGGFSTKLPDKAGTYRAVIAAISVDSPAPGSSCTAAQSIAKTHLHPKSFETAVDLKLSGHLRAAGAVQVTNGRSTSCIKKVEVKVQRKTAKGWKTMKSPKTNGSGDYSTSLPDKVGKYRAKIGESAIDVPAPGSKCLKAKSTAKSHQH